MKMTYKKAGVDIGKADRFVEEIKRISKVTLRKELLRGIGGFAAAMTIPRNMKTPLIVFSTDGVGTKLLVAEMMDDFSTVGIDLVAMNVNDILTTGAEPICFLDYIGTSRLEEKRGIEIMKGIVRGCEMAGCSLAGGETAEMPDMYPFGRYELVGFAIGIVDRGKIITGKAIKEGDVVIGLPSSGLHSNGYSLARKVLLKKYNLNERLKTLKKSLGEELLVPTKIYVKPVLKALKNGRKIKGMAHITGGGIPGNLSRVIPEGLVAEIRRNSWDVPVIFKIIQEEGKVEDAEMFRTFNMGIGFIIVSDRKDVDNLMNDLEKTGERGIIIGEIKKGKGGVKIV
jgi:phosphoribosylformylglycinamidine cyclo-ligase